MKQKIIQADYWDRKIDIAVPEDTVIGEIPAPPIIQDPEKAVRDAIANPIGAPPLAELARKARNWWHTCYTAAAVRSLIN